jgi:hypothetical protein
MMAKPTIVPILTCVLCLIVVGGALDALPDPPAVKPSSIQKNPVSRRTHSPVTATTKFTSDCLSCRLQLHINFMPTTQVLESPSFPSEPFGFHAADTSPPRPS